MLGLSLWLDANVDTVRQTRAKECTRNEVPQYRPEMFVPIQVRDHRAPARRLSASSTWV